MTCHISAFKPINIEIELTPVWLCSLGWEVLPEVLNNFQKQVRWTKTIESLVQQSWKTFSFEYVKHWRMYIYVFIFYMVRFLGPWRCKIPFTIIVTMYMEEGRWDDRMQRAADDVNTCAFSPWTNPCVTSGRFCNHTFVHSVFYHNRPTNLHVTSGGCCNYTLYILTFTTPQIPTWNITDVIPVLDAVPTVVTETVELSAPGIGVLRD